MGLYSSTVSSKLKEKTDINDGFVPETGIEGGVDAEVHDRMERRSASALLEEIRESIEDIEQAVKCIKKGNLGVDIAIEELNAISMQYERHLKFIESVQGVQKN